MNIFDYLKNESFFKPFTFKYRRIYYDCIQILIDKTKELPVLYEADAKDSITIYLKNMELQNAGKLSEGTEADSGMEEAEAGALRDKAEPGSDTAEASGGDLQASSIISLFRDCGWLLPREIGRNGEYVVNVSMDCRRIMDFLRKLTEKSGEGMMSNRIFSMYEIVRSAMDEESVRRERPYTNILVPLVDNETELKNELTDLKENISTIMKAVIAFQDINSFGQFIMKDEMLDRFFSEYFFVKNNGLIPTQISFIRNKLRALRQGEMFGKMVAECAENLQMAEDAARQRVEGDFAELVHFLSVEYEDNMELVDRRINTYYNLANTRIMLMASNGVRLESAINDFLNVVAQLPEEEQETAMEKTEGCIRIVSQKYVGYKSFEKTKRLKNEGENIGLTVAELSEEEKAAKTRELFAHAPNRYSVERVADFLKMQLGNDTEIQLKERRIRTKEEAIMYAAAVLYAGNAEFPYQIELLREVVKADIADISNMRITKKQAAKSKRKKGSLANEKK